MNKVDVAVAEVPLPAPRKQLRAFAERILRALQSENWNITILFCDDHFIRCLNHQYRNKDEPTDVLSFTMGETRRGVFYAGDIVISTQTLRQNAVYFAVDPEEELRRLIIHGILHLSGMDHETNDKNEAMLALQEKMLKEIAWV
jgi:probable rRNA maturation factor